MAHGRRVDGGRRSGGHDREAAGDASRLAHPAGRGARLGGRAADDRRIRLPPRTRRPTIVTTESEAVPLVLFLALAALFAVLGLFLLLRPGRTAAFFADADARRRFR